MVSRGAIGVPRCFDCFCIAVITNGASDGLFTLRSTGSFGCNLTLIVGVRTATPEAFGVGICIGSCTAVSCLNNRVVAVQQLCRSNGNVRIGFISLVVFMGNSLCTGSNFQFAAAVTDYLSTTGSRIHLTSSGFNRAINYNLCINKVGSLASVSFSGCIIYRVKISSLRSTVSTAVPLIAVICNNLMAIGDLDKCTGGNGNNRTRQQRNILLNGCRAAVNIHSNITVQRQDKICGVNCIGRTNFHRNAGQRCTAVEVNNQTVGSAVVFFNRIRPGTHSKHTISANKVKALVEVSTGHINCSIGFLSRTTINGQRNFNVLYIVLRQREYFIALHTTVRGLRTTAEVHKLEHFMNRRSTVCSYRTGAGNKAISIELAAVVNGNITAAFHTDKAARSGRGTAVALTALSSHLFHRQAQRAIDHQLCTIR